MYAHERGQQRREKLPTRPIHQSILSHRKRTTRGNIHVDAAKGRRARESDAGDPPETTEALNADEEVRRPQDEQHLPLSEPVSPLLTSQWWVKILEEVGSNSWNFVPESRRAASSVVFTYKYSKDRRAAEGGETNLNTTDALPGNSIDIESGSNESDSSVSVDALGQGQGSGNTPETAPAANQTKGTQEGVSDEHDRASDNHVEEEYMIISGGYTDHDWKTFPLYAFPIATPMITGSGQWIDLSPSALEDNIESRCSEEDVVAAKEKLYQEAEFLDAGKAGTSRDPWEHAQNCAPFGRMGHQSVIHDDKLYVFGGLIYDGEQASGRYERKETFRLEDVPFVYRLDLKEMFDARRAGGRGDKSSQKVTGWQRIIPRVKPFPTPAGMSSTSAAEVLLTSVNRGEMQGGLWSSELTGDHDKFVMYGGLRIAMLEYEGYGHNPSKFVNGENSLGSSSIPSHKIVELPLGDVWAYDLVLDCWEKITNNYGRPIEEGDEEKNNINDDVWFDEDISSYPRPRTAHAATVVGNELIIHGGMGWDEHTHDWDGSTDWETLDDMWILELNTREWKRRWIFPLLVRSYHSLVGWRVSDDTMMGWGKDFENNTSWDGPIVAAFGGYTTGVDVFSGEELAYVFDDLLISYPPLPSKYDEPLAPWLKASMDMFTDGAELISTRYEHSAVLSKQGVLVVWGGSFQDTKNVKGKLVNCISDNFSQGAEKLSTHTNASRKNHDLSPFYLTHLGMWMINVAGKDSAVNLAMAEPDSIYGDYERTVTALHTIVLMLMFMSISLTLLLGLTQRYQELLQQANDDAAMAAGMAFSTQDLGNDSPPNRQGTGLHPDIIETIPRKIYNSREHANSGGEAGGEESCPICLGEYSDGDELRVLPCDHFMHKTCLDSWLANNASCPSCRYSLSDLVDDRPMIQLRTLRSRLSNNAALARFLGHESYMVEGGIEMIGGIDLRYVTPP
ncbi:hypothetical protein ACHAWF_008998 [Thalassiosira exigua]